MIILPTVYKHFFPRSHSVYPLFPSLRLHWRCDFSFARFLSSQIHANYRNDVEFFHRLLRITQSYDLERPIKQIHAQVILGSLLCSAFLSARLMSVYSKLDLLTDALKVFDTAPAHCFTNSFFWNAILRSNISISRYEEALRFYGRMLELNVQPDGFGFPLIIRACAMNRDAKLCKRVHCHVIRLGFANNVYVCNELLLMYGEIGRMDNATKLFDKMRVRSCVSWNIMVSGFAKNLDWDSAIWMFSRMEDEGSVPNSVTWTSILSGLARCGQSSKGWEFFVLMRKRGISATAESIAVLLSMCADSELSSFFEGETMHGHIITAGFENYVLVSNALISMYGKNGSIGKAEYLFTRLNSKSIISWNALISSYAQAGLCDEAFSLLMEMGDSGDDSTVRSDVIGWTAVINGFVANLRHEESMDTFRCMQYAQVLANEVTIVSVLSVCAEISALSLGREIHAHAFRRSMQKELLVANGLVNMYMKCGSLRIAHSLFEGMAYRDINSWNTMITGYGMHGLGEMAVKIFHQLMNEGTHPDGVTFVALLSACSHAGLVDQGRLLFHMMTTNFKIAPQVEHYACMVDLYGRAGLVQEARAVMKSMPMEPNEHVRGALLNACKMHKNTDVAEETAPEIFICSSEVTGSYMLLSNLYADSGRWDDSAKVRTSARSRGLKKVRGQSWIEVNKRFYSFVAGKALNLDTEDYYGVLEDLNLNMVMERYLSKGIMSPLAEDYEVFSY